ncbi:hypothetical protein EG328_007457 [Venturia inaequalis]|uniref:DUF7703 domain-containing protein n=1 Tax=Venturia inaequalis TaxID=5025 RepID=A0A8H3ZK37_VENIN|nr:hypothetical protein EG328_007457 [Venturia inaequalis]KAE9994751.1 hypothetical protein EG327_003015 [Venturia inaequalis]
MESLIAACHAAAVVMAFEINLQLLSTFKRWTTLYFWSLLVASWGVILLTVSFDLTFFDQQPGGAQVLTGIGWVAMVTGFSMILYSRLHLVLYNRKHLRILLAMILLDAFLFHLPVIVSDYVKGEKGTKLYWVVSKMEIVFCAQEFFLSTLYTYLYWKLFRDETSKKEMQTTFYLLIAAQLVILCTDVVLSALLYTSTFIPRMMILPLTSALKIRIELLVLNRLAGFGQHNESITRDLLEAPSTGAVASSSPPDDKTAIVQVEERWERRQEVSIWNADGPACPEIIRPAEVSRGPARGSVAHSDRDSIDDLERQYLGRYEYEKSG